MEKGRQYGSRETGWGAVGAMMAAWTGVLRVELGRNEQIPDMDALMTCS